MRRILISVIFLMAMIPVYGQQVSPDARALPPSAPDDGPMSWQYGPFRYDPAGNIAAIGADFFLYDVSGRLVQSSVTRPDQAGSQIHPYGYDAYGNLTSKGSQTFAIDAATNRVTGGSVAYDEAGNLTQWQPPGSAYAQQFAYDPLNMMIEAKSTNSQGKRFLYIYTADDERIWAYDVSANVSHWKIRDLGGKVLRDYKDDGVQWSVDRDYFYRDGQLLAAVTPTTTEHFSLDHLGTPRLITDSSGFKIGFHHYFPFGEEWTIGGDLQDGEVMKFTGHERDADPSAGSAPPDYMHARYYSAVMGRFLSVDRVLGRASKPQSWNRYSYTLNNPLVLVDPDGHDPRIAPALQSKPVYHFTRTIDAFGKTLVANIGLRGGIGHELKLGSFARAVIRSEVQAKTGTAGSLTLTGTAELGGSLAKTPVDFSWGRRTSLKVLDGGSFPVQGMKFESHSIATTRHDDHNIRTDSSGQVSATFSAGIVRLELGLNFVKLSEALVELAATGSALISEARTTLEYKEDVRSENTNP